MPACFWLRPPRSPRLRHRSPRRSRTAPPRRFATPVTIDNIGTLAIPASAASAAISAAIGNVSTAFLTQQGSAFVSAPARSRAQSARRRRMGARRRRPGRTSARHRIPSAFRPRAAPSSIPRTINCNNQQRQTFAGAQVGADIARLNYAGWNLHLGTTAGYLGSRTTDNAGLRQRFRSSVLRHLLRRHQGTLLCRPDGSPGVLPHQPERPGPCLLQPAGRGTRLVDRGNDGIQFRSGQGLVHRAVGRLHLVEDLGRQLHRARRRRRQLHRHHRRRSDQRHRQARSAAPRCGSARPSHAERDLAAVRFGQRVPRIRRRRHVELHVPQRRSSRPRALHVQPGTTTSRVGTYGQYSLGLAGQIVEHRLARLRPRRLSQRRQHRRLDRQCRHSLPVHARNARCRHADQGSQGADPGDRGNNWTGFYAGGILRRRRGPHRHRVPGLAPGHQPAVGIRTDRRLAGSATTISSPTTGFSASKATSAPADVHGGRSAGAEFTIPA